MIVIYLRYFYVKQNNHKIPFTFSKTSEDGLGGRLQKTEAFLQSFDTTSIRISGLRIPDRPHNSKVSVSVTVSRDSPIVKRSPQGINIRSLHLKTYNKI